MGDTPDFAECTARLRAVVDDESFDSTEAAFWYASALNARNELNDPLLPHLVGLQGPMFERWTASALLGQLEAAAEKRSLAQRAAFLRDSVANAGVGGALPSELAVLTNELLERALATGTTDPRLVMNPPRAQVTTIPGVSGLGVAAAADALAAIADALEAASA